MAKEPSAAYQTTSIGPLIYDDQRFEVFALSSKRSFTHEVRITTDAAGAALLVSGINQPAEFVRSGRKLPVTITAVEPHYEVAPRGTEKVTVAVYFSYAI